MTSDPFLLLLEGLKQSTFFLSAAAGNSGDRLLQKGLELYLQNNGFLVTKDAQSADIILTHGGSNINDVWKEGIALFTTHLQIYPDKIFIVAPHTFTFRETDFQTILQNYSQTIHLFAREEDSFACLQSLGLKSNVSIYLSDDTAFLLVGTDYLNNLISQCTTEYPLYAMRTDRESAMLDRGLDRIPQNLFEKCQLLFINYRLRKSIARRSGGEPVDAKAVWQDISYLPYADFLQKVQRASVVHTDRLHVGILGALLNKPVFLYATKYKKVVGVYEKSLQDYSNVTPLFD